MKNIILYGIIEVVVIAAFNIGFFLIGGTDHVASVWVSYGFIHISYLLLVLSHLFVKEGSQLHTLRMPIYAITSTYFILEFIVGLSIIYWAPKSLVFSTLLQGLICLICVVILITNIIANNITHENIKKHEDELIFIKESTVIVKDLMRKSQYSNIEKHLDKIYYELKSSPVKSSSQVASLEREIMHMIKQLNNIVIDADIDKLKESTTEIINLINHRNNKLNLLN